MARILCPVCRESQVEAPSFTFASTSVEVKVCEPCRKARGIVSVELRKSALFDLDVPVYGTQHVDGLVTFA